MDQELYEPQVQFIRGVVGQLRTRTEAPPLLPTKIWDKGLSETLVGMTTEDIFSGYDLANPEYGEAVRSGLLLWNDDLDGSHTISQGLEDATGSYWHGIMHRREGDYSNSKYWFQRAGRHPIQEQLTGASLSLLQRLSEGKAYYEALRKAGRWDADLFVDWCAEAGDKQHAITPWLEAIQLYEMELLLGYSESVALGRNGS